MPEHTDYMVLGYVLTALMIGGLVLSIWWRYRALEQDERLIDRLEQDESTQS
jgi:heme exporter protein CcmD